MSETFRDDGPELPKQKHFDPIDNLSNLYDGLMGERNRIQNKLNETETAQKEAILAAAEPYKSGIKELRSSLDAIDRQQDVETGRQIFESSLKYATPIYKATLELLINRYWGNSNIDGFIQEIGNQSRRESDGSLLRTIKNQLAGISQLESKLDNSDSYQPVFVYGIHRYEELDEQAVFESRDSRTGIFHTDTFGYFGLVNSSSLQIQTERRALPDVFGYIKKPTAIALQINNAVLIGERPYLFNENFDRDITEDGSMTVKLLGRNESSRKPLPIEWSGNVMPDKNLGVVVGLEQIQSLKIKELDRFFN